MNIIDKVVRQCVCVVLLPMQPSPDDVSATLTSKYSIDFLSAPPHRAPVYSSDYEEAVAAATALDALDAAANGLPAVDGINGPPSASSAPSQHRPHFSELLANTRATAEDHFQDTRVLDLDLTASGVDFRPGDVIAVLPEQSSEARVEVCRQCGFDPEAWVRIRPAQAAPQHNGHSSPPTSAPLEAVLRVGALIAGVLDINSAVPRRAFFQALAQHTKPGVSQLHMDRLRHFASPAGRDDLHEYCRREGRTVVEVLRDFGAVADLRLDMLLSFAPRLHPRRFSAASSLALLPNRVQLLVAVVEWTTPGRRRRQGLCSTWLAGLAPGSRVALWAEPGALKLPDPSIGLIMVGPGTGVAPFRSFVQDRLALARALSSEPATAPGVAPSMLFFGCVKYHPSQSHSFSSSIYVPDSSCDVPGNLMQMPQPNEGFLFCGRVARHDRRRGACWPKRWHCDRVFTRRGEESLREPPHKGTRCSGRRDAAKGGCGVCVGSSRQDAK